MAVGPDDFMPNHHKYYHIIGPNHPVGGGVSMCRLMIGGDTTEVGPGGGTHKCCMCDTWDGGRSQLGDDLEESIISHAVAAEGWSSF